MMAEWETKPHGTFTDQPEKGVFILREPKGLPDVILFADSADRQKLLDASMILSVQGYTARIVCVEDPVLFMKMDAAYRESVFSSDIPSRVGVSGLINETFPCSISAVFLPHDSQKMEIAMTAVKLCQKYR